jgi:CcmD family protein
MDPRNVTYMFYGLLVVWLALALYVIALVARERKIKQELERLKHMIEEREPK